MVSLEKFVVIYMRRDLNNKSWIKQEKEFLFKDEAFDFADRMQDLTKQKAYVYKKITQYELIS